MKLTGVYFILSFALIFSLSSCERSTYSVPLENTDQREPNQDQFQKLDAESILRLMESKYLSLVYYKANGENIYSRKLLQTNSTIKREIEIEYSSPSQIRAVLREDEKEKILESKDNQTFLLVEAKRKTDFDDVYRGLTSSEFGNGTFFEIGKMLILKERGKGKISSIRNLINLQMVGEEIIDERLCYRIEGQFKHDDLSKVTHWIDKESLFVRQYERVLFAKKIPDGYFKTVETYTDIEAR